MGNNRNLISETIKSLLKADREQLKMAHEHGVPQYIKIGSSRFVGVHINGMPQLKVEESYNDWSIGTINYPGTNNER